MNYGHLPDDLGLIDLAPVEMMFWMYCPIRTPSDGLVIPDTLRQFSPIVRAALRDEQERGEAYSYAYLAAKTLWVSGEHIGNRPGWHSDGFGTDDVNYVWYDRAATQFLSDYFELPDDCSDAMAIMAERAAGKGLVCFRDKHLLRLTPSVIHRSPVGFEPGMRTFVKVSLSNDRYNLEGNSINHRLTERWPLVPRLAERNHPARAAEAADAQS